MRKVLLASVAHRAKPVTLLAVAVALTVFLALGVQRTREISRSSFARTISGTDIIIGARTGQINLILYSVFHMGNATSEISYRTFQELADQDGVAWAVPLALGDSHAGYRVIGTTTGYFDHYTYANDRQLRFASGERFSDVFDIVIGSTVARDLGYQIGDPVVVTHGQGRQALHRHDDLPFRVSGVLEPTGTPTDRALLISVEAITAIHLGWESGMQRREVTRQEALQRDLTPASITAAMIGLDSPQLAFGFQRAVNSYEEEALSAILPGAALFELWQLMSVAERALAGVSLAVVVISILALMATQLAVLDSRRREMAILRALGATPGDIAGLLVAESALITFAGCVAGTVLLYALQTILQGPLAAVGFYAPIRPPSVIEWAMLGAMMLAGSAAGFVPARGAYRRSLNDGLTVRG